MTFRKITNLFRLKPFQRTLLRHKEDYIIPIQVYVKSQTNFVSLRINSIIISKNEFMNKTNCSWAEKWQVRKNYLCEPVDIKFLISQTSPYCSGSSVFLCDFTFNKNLRFLQYFKYLYLRLQLSLFFYYPRYAIVSTSLGSCMQMADWIGLGQSVVLCVFPASCWKKHRCLNSLFYFSFSFDPYNHFFAEFFTMFW